MASARSYAERPKLSDPAHETRGLQSGRDGWVRCSMGTVRMGFKSPGWKPEIMKMNTKIPAEVKELRVIAALKEDYAKPVCR